MKNLKELVDVNHPLMEKFKEAAPGTFRHCQNVSSLCESISKELDLDLDVMRTAALLHDIGKINLPNYFSENQTDGKNPHDELDPFISYLILTKHVGDSVMILLQDGVPLDIIEIIAYHHGNTVLKSIANKSPKTDENSFRYKCKIPPTTEAAVLMITDSIEATARSLHNQGKLKNGEKRKVVESTVARLMEDGQLDEMKVGTLKVIKRVIIRELESIYHERVPYDEEGEN